MSLYSDYIASIEELKGLKRPAWVVQGYRADRFPGRWECALGSGRSVGPFDGASSAMCYAVEENRKEVEKAVAAESERARRLSALHQPEF